MVGIGGSGDISMQESPKAPTQAKSTVGKTKMPPLQPPNNDPIKPSAPKRRVSRRAKVDTNPDHNVEILDGNAALRASPDADETSESLDVAKVVAPMTPARTNGTNGIKREAKIRDDSDPPLLDTGETPAAKKQKKSPTKSSIAAKKGSDEIKAFRAEQAAKKAVEGKIKKEQDGDEWDNRQDPDGDDVGPAEEAEVLKLEAARPPPVNSDYLPLPWKGRLGYASLVIFNPPVSTNATLGLFKYISALF